MVNRGTVGAAIARGRARLFLVLLVLGGGLLLRNDAINQRTANSPANSPDRVRSAFGRLPLSFEPNRGQSDPGVKFVAHGNAYSLNLMPGEAVLSLPVRKQAGVNQASVSMVLVNASADSQMTADEPLPGHSNYFIGDDPSLWRRNIPQFAKVVSRNVYPGIDLAFYGKQGQLEYDFDVAPGADPREIEIGLRGATELHIAGNGDLVTAIGTGELRFKAPKIYQELNSGTKDISGSFVLRANGNAGFEIGPYDRNRTLVIDPVLVFSTYLGGTGNESCGLIVNGTQASPVAHCPAVAVDSASRVYVAGATTSTGAFSGATAATIGPLGATNVFVARLNPSGSALDYVSYIGGSGGQYATGVGTDGGFNVYVAGTTSSSNFPVTSSSAFQSTAKAPGTHVFFTKLDSTGSTNLYTTYLSGSSTDTASGLAVDTLGRAYIMGITNSSDFPTTPGALQAAPAAANVPQFFFAQINPGLSGSSSLDYSTYIGGGSPSNGTVTGGAVAVDGNFNVYLAGGATFTDMPLVNAYKSSEQGGFDVWAARLNVPANNTQQYTPAYETYFGGSGDDIAYGIASDGTNAYVTGSTTSSGLAAVGVTPFQGTLGGGSDAFIAKFGLPTTTGSVPLSYFTYLGGSANDTGSDIAVDINQNARVTGWTQSANFPNPNPLAGVSGGGMDAFVARIVTTGTTATNASSSSVLGGAGADAGTGVAVDSTLNTYVVGETSSPESGNFPATAGALQSSLSGSTDVFVSKLGPSTSGLTFSCSGTGCTANPTVTPSPVNVGGQVTFKYSIYNSGDPVSGVVFTAGIGQNSTFSSATASSGTCGGVSNGTVVCNLGTVNTSTASSAAATVTIVVTATTQVLPGPTSIGNSGTLTVAGSSFTPVTVSGNAVVNDFTISALPNSATVTAGAQGDYTVTVTPTGGGFPASVSLSCGSGLPAGAACVFGTGNPIPNMSNGPRSVPLAITTTFRVTTPGSLYLPGGSTYALWLPVLGAGLMGAGLSRKRRILLGAFFVVVLGTALVQVGCGSRKSTTTTTGTPTGTYTVTINATAGATRTTTVMLVVN